MLEALQRLAGMRDISELTALAEELADDFTIDHRLTLGDAIATAWGLRSLDIATIARPVIPVADLVTEGGAAVLVPLAEFSTVVIDAAPGMAPYFS